ncbi:MAG: Crp/Fnr family transcriptional regulator [Anaerolineales bacterium]|jgi:CRP/FNR family transcriptional regulator/CRP/FNR family cyclic AMP-dependent transcriptional regulator
MSKITLLRKAPLFSRLSDSELESLANNLHMRTFAKGMVIFHEGSLGQNLYMIDSGKVRIFFLSESGQEVTLNFYGAGECFGELSLLDGLPRSAGAMAIEKTVTYTLHRDDFHSNLEAYPNLALSILQELSRRLRYTSHYAASLALMDVYGRVAAKLLELADRYGMQDEPIAIKLHLTQTELATWVATSRESINKVLRGFRDQGFIQIEGGTIKILNKRELEKLARF